MEKVSKENLKFLGKKAEYKFNHDFSMLDCFENKVGEQLIKLDAFEFTTLCPITGQPDFAEILINYVPNKLIVESKSLKLYLFSFRNEGCFHETVVKTILDDLIKLLDPLYIEVLGKFNSRGGISIHPFANYAKQGGDYISWVKARKLSNLGNN